MKSLCLCLSLILLTSSESSAEGTVYGDKFQQGTVGAYLDNEESLRGETALISEAGVNGNVLKLAASAAFKLVPINDQTKYRLVFLGRQRGSETIEENPRLAELIFNHRTFLPWYRLKFFDAGRNEIKSELPSLSLPFGQWRECSWEFYPPSNASFVRLEVNTGAKGNTVYLADVRLSPAPDEAAININPAFNRGPYNYSGWSSFNGIGRLHEIEGGKTVLDTGFSAATTSFPLGAPGTYRWYLRASSYERNRTAFLVFLDAEGKEIGRISGRVTKPVSEMTSHFILPQAVARGYFLIYNSVIEEVRLTRTSNEERGAR